ncbi:MAG: serine/threonine-protein kinase [Pirellulaceae bacterium]
MVSIDESARREFERAWLSGGAATSLSIREFLPESLEGTYLGTLEELVCIDLEFRWKPAAAENSNSNQTVSVHETEVQTRVEDYLRDFPELEQEDILQRLVEQEVLVRVNAGYVVEPSEYQSRFPAVILDASLFSESGQQTRVDEVPTNQHVLELPFEFGNYVLTDRIGQGGMGAVYLAHQASAKRDVAIKIATLESLSPHGRDLMSQRFQQEAHTAAAIVHDHIVPIYDVGEVDGKPFIAMQLVQGGDLGSKTKEGLLGGVEAAKYLLGVARGMEQAHRAGLLHRDIKPQNILIDQTTNRALLTDFGLAKYTEDDSGMTQSGQLLGTPSFMAPEQIRDSSKVDVRADVYSFGATLYHLICGKAPFKAADIHETLRQVLNDEAVSPRLLNPDVEQDLETIVLKCLEKEPEARYESAGHLADDLDNYVHHRPINARPAGPVKRLMKWCRRNPRLAAAQSLAITGVLLTLVVSLIGWQATHEQWLETMAEKDKVEAERNQKEGVMNVALGSLDDLLVKIQEEPLLSAPGMETFRRELMQRAITHYQSFVAVVEDSNQLPVEQAYANASLASMYKDMNFPVSEMVEQLALAKKELAALPAGDRDTPRILESRSDLALIEGRMSHSERDFDAMLVSFEKAEVLRKRWREIDSDNPEASRKLANAKMNKGIALRLVAQQLLQTEAAEEAGLRLAESEGALFDAQDLRKEALAQSTELGLDDLKLRRDFARAEYALAQLEMANGNLAETFDRLERAEEKLTTLANEVAVDVRLWKDLCVTKIQLAEMLTAFPVYRSDESMQHDAASRINVALNQLGDLVSLSNSHGGRIELLAHYQRGLDAYVVAGHLESMANHMGEFMSVHDAVVERIEQAEMAEQYRDQLLQIHLNHSKHLSQAAMYRTEVDPATDVRANAITTIESAITEFSNATQFVEANPLLVNDFHGLQRMLNHLMEQTPVGDGRSGDSNSQ